MMTKTFAAMAMFAAVFSCQLLAQSQGTSSERSPTGVVRLFLAQM